MLLFLRQLLLKGRKGEIMKKFLLAVLVFLALAQNCYAKEFSAKITHIDSTSFPEIEVLMRVYYQESFELDPENVELKENGQKVATFSLEPQNFKHFMVLLIDRSSSIEKAMKKVKHAAAGFIKSLISGVSFSIVSFGSDIDFNHDFSQNPDSLINSIKKIRPWGGTALYDAIFDSCEELQAKAGLNDLKTVVCISDGQDSTPSGKTQLSKRNADEVCRYAIDKGVRVITLGLGEDIDGEFLAKIASSTEGWYLQTATANELARLCQSLSTRIKRRRHYKLKYKTPDLQLTSDARSVGANITISGNNTDCKRSYHAPNGVVSGQTPEDAIKDKKTTLKQLLETFEVETDEIKFLTEAIHVPHPEPVYGLTLGSFERANISECRILINNSREQIANQHRKNLEMQQKFLKQYQQIIDRRLKRSYLMVDASGMPALKRARLSLFIQFLQYRYEEVELLLQKVYEQYLVNLQTSLVELNYFDRTQVTGEKLDEKFFDTNASTKAIASASVKNKFSRLQSELKEKMSALFTPDSESSNQLVEPKKLLGTKTEPRTNPIKTME